MSKARREHWQAVYTHKRVETVSWYQPQPTPSLTALERLGASSGQSLIDVGAGASPLVGALHEAGWRDLAALDISDAALAHARAALGERAEAIEWIAADITRWRPARRYDIWHDRAVFHFLTDPADRASYRRALEAALAPGGLALFATFAPDGPQACSGLEIRQYSASDLAREFDRALRPLADWSEVHVTPSGAAQNFTWAAFRKGTP
ncbi:class I SAM-dependent methyltransferase [Qipengyuania nanhaisediminis]|uniref:class I SAM-dependent methyltransferase n=1 Tax=Qipengyuania nanhaisediminis TaxID=604088 RepID=UPI0038B28E53